MSHPSAVTSSTDWRPCTPRGPFMGPSIRGTSWWGSTVERGSSTWGSPHPPRTAPGRTAGTSPVRGVGPATTSRLSRRRCALPWLARAGPASPAPARTGVPSVSGGSTPSSAARRWPSPGRARRVRPGSLSTTRPGSPTPGHGARSPQWLARCARCGRSRPRRWCPSHHRSASVPTLPGTPPKPQRRCSGAGRLLQRRGRGTSLQAGGSPQAGGSWPGSLRSPRSSWSQA